MIDAMTIYNYSLPGESLDLNDDRYPMDNFTTEVDVRYNERVKPSEHGIWIGNTFYGKRTFHWEGAILAKDSADYIEARRALLRMLTPKSHLRPRQPIGYMDLWFTGQPERMTSEFTIESYPEIPLEALSPSRSRYQVNLKCFDPRLYGDQRSKIINAPATVGRTYPKTYDKTYSVGEIGDDDIVVENIGDVEVQPIVYFYGPATTPRAILRDPSGALTTFELLDLELLSTDIIKVDFRNKTAMNTVTGANVYSYKSGEWWSLEPGQNYVRATAAAYGDATKTIFTWRSGYLI